MDLERFRNNFISTLFNEQVVVDGAEHTPNADAIFKSFRTICPRGSVRRGRNKQNPWSMKMNNDYGKLVRDDSGEYINAFVGPNKNCSHIFIIRQVEPESGEYDEDKVMLGFDNSKNAVDSYLSHYDDPNRFGWVTVMSPDQFWNAFTDRTDLLNFKSGNISEYIPTEDVCTTGSMAIGMGGMARIVPQQQIVVGSKKKKKRVAMPMRSKRPQPSQIKNSA